MSFAWPWALSALLAVPLVLGVAWWSRRRRRRAAVRVTSAALVRAALPGRGRWQRRLPAALLLLGLAVLGVGAARPQATVAVPASSTTILLALDVSRSMCSTDVAPNRLTAAEGAAAAFIKAQPGGSRIGLVAFAGVAGVLVPPTDDTEKLLAALPTTDHLPRHRHRAGDPHLDRRDRRDRPVGEPDRRRRLRRRRRAGGVRARTPSSCSPTARTPRASTRGPRRSRPPTGACASTRSASAPRTPSPMVCDSSQVDDGYGGPGVFGGRGPGGRNPLVADEDTLKQVAATTGGSFYLAENADQLQGALADLPRAISLTREHLDIASWFSAAGGLLVAVAIGLSLWWNRVRRPPERGTSPPGVRPA